jgi:hypothetical protein
VRIRPPIEVLRSRAFENINVVLNAKSFRIRLPTVRNIFIFRFSLCTTPALENVDRGKTARTQNWLALKMFPPQERLPLKNVSSKTSLTKNCSYSNLLSHSNLLSLKTCSCSKPLPTHNLTEILICGGVTHSPRISALFGSRLLSCNATLTPSENLRSSAGMVHALNQNRKYSGLSNALITLDSWSGGEQSRTKLICLDSLIA